MGSGEGGRPAGDAGRWVALAFVFGLAVSGLMVARSQVAGDQLNHLARGWHLLEGRWEPFGPPASAGGAQPGGVTGLLVGLPLLVWRDHRAPAVLMLLFQVGGFLLLDRLARSALRPEERLLLALLYWLNPWRVFYSGFLWNPNYLFALGALHLWTAWRLKNRPRFLDSFLHVLALGLAVQLHMASLMLIIGSALLWWRRYLRLHLAGAALGAALTALSLLPWLLAVAADPGQLPVREGVPGTGLITLFPLAKGLLNWLRFSGLALSRSMVSLDFTRLGGPGIETLGGPLAAGRVALLAATLLASAWCNWRLWRHRGGRWHRRFDPRAADRSWLAGYVCWSLLATAATLALSPISVTHWYLFPVFHAAILPAVLAGGTLLRGPRARAARRVLAAYALIAVLLGPAFALGAPPYRCGEPRGPGFLFTMPALQADHPMFHELGIHATCPIVVGDPDGWWPEALGAPPAAGDTG